MTSDPPQRHLATDERPPTQRRPGRARRVLSFVGGGLAVVVLAAVIVLSLTPWPSAMVIRSVFEQGGAATTAEMLRHVPDEPLRTMKDVKYGDDADATLNLHTTAQEGKRLPTVVWVHGGAWISGSAANVDPYLQILAAEGYTGIALNYTLGPEATYPTAVIQLNTALAYILEHADELGVDPERIVLAGDSAGAQLASQLATLVTNKDYSDLLGIRPALPPSQLVGVILNCGVYDLRAMAELNGIFAWGFQVSLWAYTGTKGWSAEYSGATMSTIEFVTEDFPPTYVSGGNGDDLTWLQSIPMSNRLRELGVDVTTAFWPAQHEPALPHEYQFHLDTDEAQEALAQTLDYLGRVTAR
ncbi:MULTISPECIES: alpha/beta hydrolase [Bacteria]|uniref:alpha/beta hydrolase n=1 Tax=Bacteria TaxID=2 RepID=UPI003C799A84